MKENDYCPRPGPEPGSRHVFIRQSTIKSQLDGEPYQTHWLVKSVREGQNVQQRIIFYLGRHFKVPRKQWPALVLCIEQIVNGQQYLLGNDIGFAG